MGRDRRRTMLVFREGVGVGGYNLRYVIRRKGTLELSEVSGLRHHLSNYSLSVSGDDTCLGNEVSYFHPSL